MNSDEKQRKEGNKYGLKNGTEACPLRRPQEPSNTSRLEQTWKNYLDALVNGGYSFVFQIPKSE